MKVSFLPFMYIVAIYSIELAEAEGQRHAGGAGGELSNRRPEPPAQMHNVPVNKNDNSFRKTDDKRRWDGSMKKSSSFLIVETAECSGDIDRLCKRKATFDKKMSNFEVLRCLSDVQGGHEEISEGCQQIVYDYKLNLTKDSRFDSAATSICKEEFDRHTECRDTAVGTGLKISCLMDHVDDETPAVCRRFLNKMKSLVFTDYRMIYRFTDNCQADIKALTCGRVENGEDSHSQGAVLDCLTKNLRKVQSRECKKHLLRVAELQSDDFHYDRPLYFACYDDREKFCSRVEAGEGRVYKCLTKNIDDPQMSEKCREKLSRRERVVQQDYKVDMAFVQACISDIKKSDCLTNMQEVDFEEARMSVALKCLEGRLKMGEQVTGECISEMRRVQSVLLSDYSISSNVASDCHKEISNYCGSKLEKGGKTLHCLMNVARMHNSTAISRSNKNRVKLISDTCLRSLEELLEIAEPTDDWRIDPHVVASCQDTVERYCTHVKPGEGRVIDCLMSMVGSDRIELRCQDAILELQYFVSRDWRLTPRLYRVCHEDAVKYCDAKTNWHDPTDTEPSHGPLVFTCLFRKLIDTEEAAEDEDDDDVDEDDVPRDLLSKDCAIQVRKTVRRRALSVDLNPEIEENCLYDLSYYCSKKTDKGEEQLCLQRHYAELEEDCKEVITQITREENASPDLDIILMKACLPTIQKHCEDVVKQERSGEAMMSCLIENKGNVDMHPKCRAGIEHHQLIALKDVHFSHKFKEACKPDAVKLCQKSAKSKNQVISCLSEHIRNATLLGNEIPVSPRCRSQLRVELLQRSSSVNLDPDLKEKCELDIATHCSNISPGNGQIISCLKQKQKSLSPPCAKFVFKREQIEVIDVRTDFKLKTACGSAIRTYCKSLGLQSDSEDLFNCLKENMNDVDFPEKCQRVIHSRMVLRSKDIRLNPRLERACGADIDHFCSEEKAKMTDMINDGGVITCLRRVYSEGKKKRHLSESCRKLIKHKIVESQLDYRLDPALGKLCVTELQKFCKAQIQEVLSGAASADIVEECLKASITGAKEGEFTPPCKMEVIRLIREGEPDIHVDVHLYQECNRDIIHFCEDVLPGEGRQMSCLLSVLQDKNLRLETRCREELTARKKLWDFATVVEAPRSIGEAASHVLSGPARQSILATVLIFLGVIFLLGLTCGRVTKRVAFAQKSK